jgi:hypothetical protein
MHRARGHAPAAWLAATGVIIVVSSPTTAVSKGGHVPDLGSALGRIRIAGRRRRLVPCSTKHLETWIGTLHAYYRTVVSSEIFTKLDHYLWKLTYKWAKHSHPNKPTRWIIRRYFGKFSKSRQDQWVFGDRGSGAYLLRFAWTKIVRHQMVNGTSSRDDPALASYWTARRRRGIPRPMGTASLRLLESQHGRCPLCGELLLDADRPPQSPREWNNG